jgi:hypothetical protein
MFEKMSHRSKDEHERKLRRRSLRKMNGEAWSKCFS